MNKSFINNQHKYRPTELHKHSDLKPRSVLALVALSVIILNSEQNKINYN